MKVKTIYTEEHGPVVSVDDFDILYRSHDSLLRALERAKISLLALGMDAGHNHMVKIDSAINKAKRL